MGSVKAGLHDGPYQPGHVHGVYSPVVWPPGEEPVEAIVNPTLTLLLRDRVGYSEDGNPVYDWTSLQSGEAFLFEQREEYDPVAGATLVRARAMMANTQGVSTVPESSIVREDETGYTWEVTSSSVLPTTIELHMRRTSSEDVGTVEPVAVEPVVETWRGIGAEAFTFTHPGALTAPTEVLRLPVKGGVFRVVSVAATLAEGPSAGSVSVDVRVNGTTIYTDAAARPTFGVGMVDAAVGVHDDVEVATGDWITVHYDPGAASGLVVVVRLERIE